MKLGVDFTQASTIRGLVWVIGGFIAIAFLIFSSQEKAMSAMSITATVAGGLGIAIKDK